MLDLQKPFGCLLQRFLGNQPNDLTACRHCAVAGSLCAHHFEDAMDGRLLKVGQVRGDLRLTAHQKSRSFHISKATGRKPDGLGDLLRDFDIGSVQKNVVGNQELARSHNACSRSGMKPGFAEVGFPRRVGDDFGTNALELSAPDVLEILALRRSSCGFVQIDRNFVALPYLFADMPCHGNAIFDSYAFYWDEGYDISGTKPWMSPAERSEAKPRR